MSTSTNLTLVCKGLGFGADLYYPVLGLGFDNTCNILDQLEAVIISEHTLFETRTSPQGAYGEALNVATKSAVSVGLPCLVFEI